MQFSKMGKMEKNFLQVEQIDNYLSGKLSEEERAEVNRRLAEDSEFRDLFDEIELLRKGIRRTGARSTKEEKLEKLAMATSESDRNIHFEKPKAKQVSLFQYANQYKLAIAAAITLIVVSWFALTTITTSNPEDLFKENFTAYTAPNGSTRGDRSEAMEGMAAAYADYSAGNYAGAARGFEGSMSESTNIEKDKFYLGNSYLSIGDAEKAVELFTEVIDQNGPLKILATWYLGLSYLQLDEVGKAKASFKSVVEADAEKADEAREILRKL